MAKNNVYNGVIRSDLHHTTPKNVINRPFYRTAQYLQRFNGLSAFPVPLLPKPLLLGYLIIGHLYWVNLNKRQKSSVGF